jgi:hypothetical protein
VSGPRVRDYHLLENDVGEADKPLWFLFEASRAKPH